MEMKKLRSRMLIVWGALITIIWVVLPVFVWLTGPTYTSKSDYLAFFLWDCFIPVFIVPLYKNYRRHCISYGNGKIIIKRERKRVENGRLARKWEVQEDEIALRDIQWYGQLLLGESAEFLSDGYSSIRQHFYICINSGEHFEFVSTHYTKGQMQELCSYIEEYTGMAPTIRRVEYSTKDKILVIVFVVILFTVIGLGLYYDYAG